MHKIITEIPQTTINHIKRLSEKAKIKQEILVLTALIIGLNTLSHWIEEEDE